MSLTSDRVQGEAGQGLPEYALIVALVAAVAIAALVLLGGNASTAINTAGSNI